GSHPRRRASDAVRDLRPGAVLLTGRARVTGRARAKSVVGMSLRTLPSSLRTLPSGLGRLPDGNGAIQSPGECDEAFHPHRCRRPARAAVAARGPRAARPRTRRAAGDLRTLRSHAPALRRPGRARLRRTGPTAVRAT